MITIASTLRPKLNSEFFFEMVHHAKPGDLVFTRTPYAAYNLLIPGFWTHCAIYVGYDRFQILDSSGRGVAVRSLVDLWTYASAASLGKVLAPRLEVEGALDEALSLVGSKYDWTYSGRNQTYYCSELIYKSYGSLLDVEPSRFRNIVAPNDIYKDKNVEIILSSRD